MNTMKTANESGQQAAKTGNGGVQQSATLNQESKQSNSATPSKQQKAQQTMCLKSLKTWANLAAKFGVESEFKFDPKTGELVMRSTGWL